MDLLPAMKKLSYGGVPISKRKSLLRSMMKMMTENEVIILDALEKDLGKSRSEGFLTEVGLVCNGIHEALLEMDEFLEDEQVSVGAYRLMPDLSASIRKVPLGLVMVIGAWNYPFQLTLLPLVGAIAGGNTVVAKPSEIAVHSAKLMQELLDKYVDRNYVRCVQGGVKETVELVNYPNWDLIFFTGSTAVGKSISQAAAKNLVPVVLELGGKSPTVVDKNVDLYVVAKRIMYGKMINSGQTCIAPDYIINLDPSKEDKLVQMLIKVACELYSVESLHGLKHAAVAKHVVGRHVDRLEELVKETEAIPGSIITREGEADFDAGYVPFTFVQGIDKDNIEKYRVMKEELFGPILPIISVGSIEEGLGVISRVGPTPLILYVFSSNSHTIERAENVNAGNMLINDTVLNGAVPTIPFGGVGDSGHGSYHGKFSLECFTRKQGVLKRSLSLEALNNIRYPGSCGYNGFILKMIRFMIYTDKEPNFFQIWFNRYWRNSAYAFALILFGAIVGRYVKMP